MWGKSVNRIKCRIVWTRSRSVITSRLELVWGGGESTSGGTVKPREESFYFACPHDVFKDTFTCRRDHPFHVIPIPCLRREFDARHPAVHRSFLPLPLNPAFNPFPTPFYLNLFTISLLLCQEETRNRPWDWEQDFLTTSYTFLHLLEEEWPT